MCRLDTAILTVRPTAAAVVAVSLPPGNGAGPRPAAAARVAASSASYAGRWRPDVVFLPGTGAISLSCWAAPAHAGRCPGAGGPGGSGRTGPGTQPWRDR